MDKIWDKVEKQIASGSVFYIGLAVLWALTTIGIGNLEKLSQWNELKAYLESKVLFVAVVFLGRFLFFPQYRSERGRLWTILLGTLLVVGTQSPKFLTGANWGYAGLIIADSMIWGFFLSTFGESLVLTWLHWKNQAKVAPTLLINLWQRFWQELMQSGFLLLIFLSLVYYYLVSFYLVDTVAYCFILLIPLVAWGVGLYWIIRSKVRRWIREELLKIDQEISLYLHWQTWIDQPEFNERFPWIEYLFQIRNYLYFAMKPQVSAAAICLYIVYSGFILILPFLFGLIAEV